MQKPTRKFGCGADAFREREGTDVREIFHCICDKIIVGAGWQYRFRVWLHWLYEGPTP